MLSVLSALAASAALQTAAPVYSVEVLVQDKRGLFGTRSVKVSQEISLEDGSFEVDASNAIVLEGDIETDGDRVRIDMTVCRPRETPCEVIATPTLNFRLGAEASIRQTTLRSSWEISFEPE